MLAQRALLRLSCSGTQTTRKYIKRLTRTPTATSCMVWFPVLHCKSQAPAVVPDSQFGSSSLLDLRVNQRLATNIAHNKKPRRLIQRLFMLSLFSCCHELRPEPFFQIRPKVIVTYCGPRAAHSLASRCASSTWAADIFLATEFLSWE